MQEESGFSAQEAAKITKLSTRRVNGLAKDGLVGIRITSEKPRARPRFRFDFRDIVVLRMTQRLQDEGVAPARIKRVLNDLRKRAPSTHLASVSLAVRDREITVEDEVGSWDALNGQGRLPFLGARRNSDAADSEPLASSEPQSEPTIPTVSTLNDMESADHWFDVGLSLEQETPAKAYEAYLRALACNPEHVEANINIGRLCSEAGDGRKALAYFRQAARIAPEHPVARFNMAVALHDLGELGEARVHYGAALTADPEFCDVHFNLAILLEELGDKQSAQQHMMAYRASLEGA